MNYLNKAKEELEDFDKSIKTMKETSFKDAQMLNAATMACALSLYRSIAFSLISIAEDLKVNDTKS